MDQMTAKERKYARLLELTANWTIKKMPASRRLGGQVKARDAKGEKLAYKTGDFTAALESAVREIYAARAGATARNRRKRGLNRPVKVAATP
jgi:hypothetical protein